MKSLASLALVLASAAPAQEPPAGDAPRGSSQIASGEVRFDAVGRTVIADGTGVRGLNVGDYVEMTVLDTGKTVVFALDETLSGVGDLAVVSPRVATALGLGGPSDVRIRRVTVTPPEVAQLRHGDPIVRIDAPPVLLAGLRKRLPATPSSPPPSLPAPAKTTPPPKPETKQTPPSAKPAPPPSAMKAGHLWVQVASLSSQTAARALAAKVKGAVSPIGRLHRVRIGPLADRAAAERVRARMVSLGYRDAGIVKSD